MDEKNKRMSFLDLLEHMRSYLGNARKTGGDIAERQKSLTEQEASTLSEQATRKDDGKPEDDPDR
jgi:hypothetical protein